MRFAPILGGLRASLTSSDKGRFADHKASLLSVRLIGGRGSVPGKTGATDRSLSGRSRQVVAVSGFCFAPLMMSQSMMASSPKSSGCA